MSQDTGVMANVCATLNKTAFALNATEIKTFATAFESGEGLALKDLFGGDWAYKLQAIIVTSTDTMKHQFSIYGAYGAEEPYTDFLIGSVKVPPMAGANAIALPVDAWHQFRFSWQAQASQAKALYLTKYDNWRESIAFDRTAPSFIDDFRFRVALAAPVSTGARICAIAFADSY